MVPGRAVAFDVSYAVAVATTSIVVIVMLPTDCRGSLMAEALTKAGMLTLEIDGQMTSRTKGAARLPQVIDG